MTFRLIDEERAHHAVSRMCSVLDVTRQGYAAWKRRQERPGPRRAEDARLKPLIRRVWEQSRGTYGAPRLYRELRDAHQERVSRTRIARLMHELGICGVPGQRRRPRTTIPDRKAAPAPDLIGREFTATRPDERWVADITYVPTREGYLFLAGVMDLYSRRIVGWSMRDTLEAAIVVDAVGMAIHRRSPAPGLIHHSDSEYVLAGCSLVV